MLDIRNFKTFFKIKLNLFKPPTTALETDFIYHSFKQLINTHLNYNHTLASENISTDLTGNEKKDSISHNKESQPRQLYNRFYELVDFEIPRVTYYGSSEYMNQVNLLINTNGLPDYQSYVRFVSDLKDSKFFNEINHTVLDQAESNFQKLFTDNGPSNENIKYLKDSEIKKRYNISHRISKNEVLSRFRVLDNLFESLIGSCNVGYFTNPDRYLSRSEEVNIELSGNSVDTKDLLIKNDLYSNEKETNSVKMISNLLPFIQSNTSTDADLIRLNLKKCYMIKIADKQYGLDIFQDELKTEYDDNELFGFRGFYK
ncbi:unnamed protein product [[Candida] boidinii]|uniref:Unnamed protein product n=1 Tax=Candida boidinii TaxID=5477 RepID=A0A9W6WFP5_CANBO|nr:hypothetical protein B5S30_g968 [[Candida] boidinii]OWB81623.1 hypothetical protein B5S33_g242 [[Candida] boidinii]GME67450.1 unnamed protein product [[Candida] boidinii]GMF05550.1 unnamed protein product [[Candida] boidinii]